jgi:hypothetical protein
MVEMILSEMLCCSMKNLLFWIDQVVQPQTMSISRGFRQSKSNNSPDENETETNVEEDKTNRTKNERLLHGEPDLAGVEATQM